MTRTWGKMKGTIRHYPCNNVNILVFKNEQATMHRGGGGVNHLPLPQTHDIMGGGGCESG